MGDKLTVGRAVFGPTFAEKAGVVQTGANAEHVLPVDNDMLRRRIATLEADLVKELAENARLREALTALVAVTPEAKFHEPGGGALWLAKAALL